MTAAPRALPLITAMHRGQLPACSCRHAHVDGPHRQSGRTASPERNTPSTHVADPGKARIADRDKAGVRARTTRTTNQAHAPPARPAQPIHDQPGLTPRTCTEKERAFGTTKRCSAALGPGKLLVVRPIRRRSQPDGALQPGLPRGARSALPARPFVRSRAQRRRSVKSRDAPADAPLVAGETKRPRARCCASALAPATAAH
jgi:hypothetical protein